MEKAFQARVQQEAKGRSASFTWDVRHLGPPSFGIEMILQVGLMCRHAVKSRDLVFDSNIDGNIAAAIGAMGREFDELESIAPNPAHEAMAREAARGRHVRCFLAEDGSYGVEITVGGSRKRKLLPPGSSEAEMAQAIAIVGSCFDVEEALAAAAGALVRDRPVPRQETWRDRPPML
jgi:hypothetical protein